MKHSLYMFTRSFVLAAVLVLQGVLASAAYAVGVGGAGMYQWSVELRGYISNETGKAPEAASISRPAPAPYALYKGDKHDAFWYFDKEMAQLTEARYKETAGKRVQCVGFEYQGKLIPFNEKAQGGMQIRIAEANANGSTDNPTFKQPIRIRLKAVYTYASHNNVATAHGTKKPYIEVVSGPLKKIDDTTFEVYPYEAGWDNPRRSFTAWVVAVADADGTYKGAVQPLRIDLR